MAGVYLFAILPLVHDFEMLVLVFAPPFLLLGLLIPKPQYTMLGMLMAVNTASFVAMQNRYSVDFAVFANEGLAAMTGLVFAFAWTVATRPFGAEIAARRLVQAGWADLAELASGHRPGDNERLAGRMLDRLGQLVPRLAAIEDRELARIDGFAELRVGFNIIELQKARRGVAAPCRSAIDAALAGVAGLYRERITDRRFIAPPARLCDALDEALRLAAHQSGAQARRSRDALVGLRRVFFPEMPGPAGRLVPQPAAAGLLLAAE